MKLSSLKVNSAEIEAGRWVGKADFPEMGDFSVHVRGGDNLKARAMRMQLLREHRNDMTPQTSDFIDAKVYSETVILDWAGLEDDSGPVLFSQEKAFKLLSNPDFRPLKDWISVASVMVGRVEAQAVEADVKN